MRAFRSVARASAPEEVLTGISGYMCPAQNLVMAFESGDLMFTLLGRSPKRRRGDGRMPAPGWDLAYGWDGLVEAEGAPRILRPEEDLLVTANARVIPRGEHDDAFVADYMPDDRQRRIHEVLESRRDWDSEGMARVQTDLVSPFARDVIAALERPDEDSDAVAAYEMLRSWDFATSSPGPSALFAFFAAELASRVFDDEARAYGLKSFASRARLLRLLSGGMSSTWFDDVSTPDIVENRAGLVEGALAAAWREARERFGGEAERWRFDDLERLTLRHPFNDLVLIGRWTRRGPFGVFGDASVPNAMISRRRGNYLDVLYGPSMRWVVDWGSPERAWSVLPGGQSGHPSDPPLRRSDSSLSGRAAATGSLV